RMPGRGMDTEAHQQRTRPADNACDGVGNSARASHAASPCRNGRGVDAHGCVILPWRFAKPAHASVPRLRPTGPRPGPPPCAQARPIIPPTARRTRMRALSLSQANAIIAATFAAAEKHRCRPMSAIILDAGGRVKAFQKQDGASMLRFEICHGKAYASLAL